MIDLTHIFQAIVALLAMLITHKLIPWLKARTTKQQQDNIQSAAKIAVFAAEQIFGSGNGESKLDYALGVLRRAGYNIDASLAREAIEKAVAEMNWEYAELEPLELAPQETSPATTEQHHDAGDAPDIEQSHPPEATAE